MGKTVLEYDATITSERLELTAMYLIGRWWAKVEQAKAKGCDDSVLDAYGNFWFGVNGLQSISVACPEAVHFALAMNTQIQRVAKMIKDDLGVDPFNDPMWKD